MREITEEFLQEITQKIVDRFHPRRIILFGSRARGQADRESDIDLFVEMESDLSPPERAIEVDRVFGLRNWALDLFVYTPQEAEARRDVHGTLMSTIEAEGRLLYERAQDELQGVGGQV